MSVQDLQLQKDPETQEHIDSGDIEAEVNPCEFSFDYCHKLT